MPDDRGGAWKADVAEPLFELRSDALQIDRLSTGDIDLHTRFRLSDLIIEKRGVFPKY
jgi:hypothetical protein